MPRSARLSLHPYRLPSEDCIDVGPWLGGCDGEESILPLGDRIDNWASDRDLNLRVSIRIDIDRIEQECLLTRSPGSTLSLVGRIWCKATNYRIAFAHEPIERDAGDGLEFSLQGVVDGALLADRVELSVELLVMDIGEEPSTLTPQLPTSRLFTSESKQVALEGIGGQFPMKAVDFNHLVRLRDHRIRALWYLDFAQTELTDDLHGGGVRLLLNSKHPDYSSLEDAISPAIGSILAADLASQLIHRLASTPAGEMPDEGEMSDTSIGGVAKRAAAAIFGESTHRDLINRVRRDPGLVNSLCQAHHSIRMYDEEDSDQ